MIYLVERFELFVQRRLVVVLQKLSAVADLLLPFGVFQFDRFESERKVLDDTVERESGPTEYRRREEVSIH